MAEWGALLRRCPCKADRGFKSLPLRQIRRRVVATVLCTAIAIAGSLPIARAFATTCTQTHVAKPNDSWTRLAARFNTSLKSLLALNSAETNTPIFVGDSVCISSRQHTTSPIQQFTRKEVRTIIRDVWPDDLEEIALFIAKRESNFVPSAVGGSSDCCVGLFQIYWSVHRTWLTTTGVTRAEQLLNPRVNAEAALELYRRNGNSWRPWWTSSWRP